MGTDGRPRRTAGEETDRGARARRCALETKDFIEEHLDEAYTIRALAARLNVGRAWLCQAFKDEVGMGIGEYTHLVRRERCRRLLAETSLPIAEIARSLGFVRPGSFTEVFKAREGVTPSEWRRAHRGTAGRKGTLRR